MQRLKTMVLQSDLLKKTGGQPRFDAELVLDLQAGATAIASVRRCASTGRHEPLR